MSVSDVAGLVREHAFAAGLPERVVALLSGCATPVRFADRERLLHAGEPAACTYLLRAGRVALALHDGHAAETVEPGEALGWSWLLDDQPVHFDAVAVGAVRALALDGRCLRAACDADPAVGDALARRFLREATRRLERSRLQCADVYGSAR